MKKTKLPVLVMCLVVLSINVIYAKASEKNSSEHKNIALPIDIPNSPPNTFQIMLQTIRQFFGNTYINFFFDRYFENSSAVN